MAAVYKSPSLWLLVTDPKAPQPQAQGTPRGWPCWHQLYCGNRRWCTVHPTLWKPACPCHQGLKGCGRSSQKPLFKDLLLSALGAHGHGLILEHTGDPSAALVWEPLAPPTHGTPCFPESSAVPAARASARGAMLHPCHWRAVLPRPSRPLSRAGPGWSPGLCIQRAAGSVSAPQGPGGGGRERGEDSAIRVLKPKEG